MNKENHVVIKSNILKLALVINDKDKVMDNLVNIINRSIEEAVTSSIEVALLSKDRIIDRNYCTIGYEINFTFSDYNCGIKIIEDKDYNKNITIKLDNTVILELIEIDTITSIDINSLDILEKNINNFLSLLQNYYI